MATGTNVQIPAKRRGLTLLDVSALVVGAALASVHARPAFIQQTSVLGRAMVVPAFLVMTLTAAGPFLLLIRRWADGVVVGPADDLRYWSSLGLPWIVAALVRAGFPGARVAVQVVLFAGLLMASVHIVVDQWRSQVHPHDDPAPPEPATRPSHWTNPVSSAIAIAWPLQFACGMLVQDQS